MRKLISFLVNFGFTRKGYAYQVKEEDDKYLYYYDQFKRWCAIEKEEEGKIFEYIGKDKNGYRTPSAV